MESSSNVRKSSGARADCSTVSKTGESTKEKRRSKRLSPDSNDLDYTLQGNRAKRVKLMDDGDVSFPSEVYAGRGNCRYPETVDEMQKMREELIEMYEYKVFKNRHQAALQEADSRSKEKDEEIATLRERVDATTSKASLTEDKLKKALRENSIYTTTLENEKSLSERRHERLTQALKSKNFVNEQLLKSINSACIDRTRLQEESRRQSLETSALHERIKELETANQKLQRTLTAVSPEIHALKTAVSQRDEEISNAKSAFKTVIAGKETEIQRLRSESGRHQQVIESCKSVYHQGYRAALSEHSEALTKALQDRDEMEQQHIQALNQQYLEQDALVNDWRKLCTQLLIKSKCNQKEIKHQKNAAFHAMELVPKLRCAASSSLSSSGGATEYLDKIDKEGTSGDDNDEHYVGEDNDSEDNSEDEEPSQDENYDDGMDLEVDQEGVEDESDGSDESSECDTTSEDETPYDMLTDDINKKASEISRDPIRDLASRITFGRPSQPLTSRKSESESYEPASVPPTSTKQRQPSAKLPTVSGSRTNFAQMPMRNPRTFMSEKIDPIRDDQASRPFLGGSVAQRWMQKLQQDRFARLSLKHGKRNSTFQQDSLPTAPRSLRKDGRHHLQPHKKEPAIRGRDEPLNLVRSGRIGKAKPDERDYKINSLKRAGDSIQYGDIRPLPRERKANVFQAHRIRHRIDGETLSREDKGFYDNERDKNAAARRVQSDANMHQLQRYRHAPQQVERTDARRARGKRSESAIKG